MILQMAKMRSLRKTPKPLSEVLLGANTFISDLEGAMKAAQDAALDTEAEAEMYQVTADELLGAAQRHRQEAAKAGALANGIKDLLNQSKVTL